MLQGVVAARERNAEVLCPAVAEVVARAALQSNAVVHHRLNGVGRHSACKLFFLGLLAGHSRNGEHVLVELLVGVQHAHGLFHGLFCGFVHGVAFLPQELGGAQERTRRFLPAHNGAPLVVELRQVAVRVDDLLVMLAEENFTRRAYAQALTQLLAAAFRYPGHFRRKALYVVFFLLQEGFRDEQRHVNVLVTRRLKAIVQFMLNVFPDRVAVRLDDHAAFYAGVIHQLGFFNNIGVPFGKVNVHGSDVVDHLLLIRQEIQSFHDSCGKRCAAGPKAGILFLIIQGIFLKSKSGSHLYAGRLRFYLKKKKRRFVSSFLVRFGAICTKDTYTQIIKS